MTDSLEFLPQRSSVDWRGFGIAAGAAPLVIGIGGALLVVPAFAAVLGFPAYALLGLPLFALAIVQLSGRAGSPSPWMLAGVGLVANVGTYLLYFVGLEASGFRPARAQDLAEFCFLFGIIFAPMHGLVFGVLYRWVMRPGDSVPRRMCDALTGP